MRRLKSAYELATKRIIKTPKDLEKLAPETFEFVTDFEYPEEKTQKGEIGDIDMQDPEKIVYEGKPLEVCWDGNVLDYGGFARVNRTFIFGLSNRNVNVKVGIQKYHQNVNKATHDLLKEMSKHKVSPKAPKVFGASMPMDMSHSGKKILFTMIETSNSIHKDYAEKLNLFDEIWVPTENGKALLESSSVCSPIYVIPLGVDAERYHPSAPPLKLNTKLNDFRFVSVFKWSYRKGPDLLLKAYLEEFSAKDNVSLLLVTRALNVPEEIGVKTIMEDFEAVKASINKPEEDLPHVALYPELIPERKMPSLYTACDAFVLLSRGEGFGLPYCFVKDTKVRTNEGYKNIQDISINEKVLTDDGNFNSVTETHKNTVTSSFSNIKTLLGGAVLTTSNHAFKAIKKPLKSQYKNKRLTLNKYLSQAKPSWVRAKDLEKGDYLVYPVRNYKGREAFSFDIMSFVEDKSKVKIIESGGKEKVYSMYSNGKVKNSDIAIIAGVSKRQVGHYKQDGKVNKNASEKIRNIIDSIPIEEQKSCVFRNITMGADFARLLGYYCAEGNLLSKENGIEFNFHANETQYHKEVESLVYSCLGLKTITTIKDNKASVRICNSIVAKMMKSMCGNHASNKRIPSCIYGASKDITISFLNGYINGDGHSSYEANILSISTASEEMARGYRSLLMDFGEVCSMTKDNRNIFNCVCSGEPKIHCIEKDLRHKPKSERWNVWSDDKYIYIPIIAIDEEKMTETVYNIDVDCRHSYVADIFTVHNCEASACGLPVIGTNCTGQMDFLNNENSFLVEPEEYAISSLNSVGTFAKMAKMSHFYEDQYFPVFGNDSIGQAKRHMRYIYENKADAQIKNTNLRMDLIKKYNWEDSITKAYNRLLESQ